MIMTQFRLRVKGLSRVQEIVGSNPETNLAWSILLDQTFVTEIIAGTVEYCNPANGKLYIEERLA